MSDSILVGKSGGAKNELRLLAEMANRHGLIAGATGTGKTSTLRVIAEGLSRLGVPVFLADVKGDLAGLCKAGETNQHLEERRAQLGLSNFSYRGCPVTFWDLFGEQGHPVRATVSDMGPLLFARLLNLNETQEGVLTLVFKIADDNGLLLLDLKDLQAMLQHVGEHAKEFTTHYGNISAASIGAIQRGLLTLEQQGGEKFFGEPALNLEDLIRMDRDGLGVINILAADKLMQSPKLYSTFLLWLLSELFERLPELGDVAKPKLVFFFDEAHLLFDEAPKSLLDKIEQVVRLIRSKGVGVYFASQNPLDIPEDVLGQLGNRVQHALRAFTPKDQKAVKAAANTFRGNPGLDVAKVITELGVGEALLSLLDAKGIPVPVEQSLICPPESFLGAITADERQKIIRSSALFGQYEKIVDRESAYERLQARAEKATEKQSEKQDAASSWKLEIPKPEVVTSSPRGRSSSGGRPRQTASEAFLKSAARSVGSQVGRQLVRGILGSLLR